MNSVVVHLGENAKLYNNSQELKNILINLKSENINIDNTILEVRTKLILLHELGIIKKLKEHEPFKRASQLCKFLTEIFETKEENKKKISLMNKITKHLFFYFSYRPPTAKSEIA